MIKKLGGGDTSGFLKEIESKMISRFDIEELMDLIKMDNMKTHT
jgi:hypothetical protein